MPPIPLDPTDLKRGDKGKDEKGNPSIPTYISGHVFAEQKVLTGSMIVVIIGICIGIVFVLYLIWMTQKRHFQRLDTLIMQIKAGEIRPQLVVSS